MVIILSCILKKKKQPVEDRIDTEL